MGPLSHSLFPFVGERRLSADLPSFHGLGCVSLEKPPSGNLQACGSFALATAE